MEFKLNTPFVKKLVGKKVNYELRNSNFKHTSVIEEVYKKQIHISGDWIPFCRFTKLELCQD